MVPGPGDADRLAAEILDPAHRLPGGGRDQERDRRRAHVRDQHLHRDLARPGAPDRLVERRQPRCRSSRSAQRCHRLGRVLRPLERHLDALGLERAERDRGVDRQVRRVLRGPAHGHRQRPSGSAAADAGEEEPAEQETRARAPSAASPLVVLIMSPPCWRRRRSCPGPTRGAAACSGSTTACTGDTARSAGGRPAPGSRSSLGRSSRRTPPGATPSGRSRDSAPPAPSTSAPCSGLSPARLAALLRPVRHVPR